MMTAEQLTPVGGDDGETTMTGSGTGHRGGGLPRWLPWAVAFVAVVVAVVTTVRWQALASEASTREDVAASAGGFMLDLTTWDASDGLADTREELRGSGTGRFVDEVDQLFGGPLGADLESADARSTGEVQDVFTQSIDGDTAVVFAVALQRLESNLAPEPDITVRSARLTLERVDGVWLIENVELLSDANPITESEPEPTDEETPS